MIPRKRKGSNPPIGKNDKGSKHMQEGRLRCGGEEGARRGKGTQGQVTGKKPVSARKEGKQQRKNPAQKSLSRGETSSEGKKR